MRVCVSVYLCHISIVPEYSQRISEPPESLRHEYTVYSMTHAHWFASGLHCGVPFHEDWKKSLSPTHRAPTHWKPVSGSWINPVWKKNVDFFHEPGKSTILRGRVCDLVALGSEQVKQDVLVHNQVKGDGYSSPAISAMQLCAVNSLGEGAF